MVPWTNYPRFLPPDLGRVRHVLQKLGNPHLQLPAVIHVAGTNGKGSVVNNVRAILEAAGKSCHVYTSPHLIRLNERILIRGEEISDHNLDAFKKRVDGAAQGIPITWFDVLTCIAFLAFAENSADYTLLETGLGGRYDATNVAHPLLVLLTSISLDHQEQLGTTLAEIVHEKAGIIKEGVPVIVGPNTKEVQHLLASYRPFFCGEPSFDYLKDNQEHARQAGRLLNIPDSIIEEALTKASLPGRFQKLGKNIYIDGAHNEGGARALADKISSLEKPVTLVLGMGKSRKLEDFLKPFRGKVEAVFFPELTDEYFQSAKEACTIAASLGFKARVCVSLSEATQKALSAQEEITIFTGSLHFLGLIQGVGI